MVKVAVINGVEHALKMLKKKLQREGVNKSVRNKRYYEKPSVKKKRKQEESAKRVRKLRRKFSYEGR